MASRLLSRSKTLTLALTRSPLPSPSSLIDPIASHSQPLRCLYSFSSAANSPPSVSRSTISSSPAISTLLGHPKVVQHPLALRLYTCQCGGCGSESQKGRGEQSSLFYIKKKHLSALPDKICLTCCYATLKNDQNFNHEKILPRWFCVKSQGTQIHPSAEKKILQKIINASSKIEGKDVIEPDRDGSEKVICFSPLEAAFTKARSDGLVKESSKVRRYELSQKITFALIPPLLLLSKSSLTTSLLVFCVYWQIYGFFKEIFLDYVHHEVTREWVLAYFKVLLLILAKDTIINFGLV